MKQTLKGFSRNLFLRTAASLSIIFMGVYSAALSAEQARPNASDSEAAYEMFNGQPRLMSAVTASGVIFYDYDDIGRLSAVTISDNGVRQYHYENESHVMLLTAITDVEGGRVNTQRYDGLAKLAFSTSPKSDSTVLEMNVEADTVASLAENFCPNTLFDDGKMWSGDLEYVDNECLSEGIVCESTFFDGLYERHNAVCINGQWQLDNPTIDVQLQDRCPNAVFDNGNMWNSEINLVDNTCSNIGRVCPSTFFSSLGRYFDTFCSANTWQPVGLDLSATDICPNTIFADGSIISGDFQYKENSCSSVRQVCPSTWYSDDEEFSGSVCVEGKWQKQPLSTAVIRDSGPSALDLPIGGAMNFWCLLAMSSLVLIRRRFV